MRRIDKLKRITTNLLIFSITLLFCFTIAEISIRVLHDKTLTPDYWPAENTKFIPELKRELHPNIENFTKTTSEFSYKLSTNDEGFRDFHAIKKKEDTSRIIAIGDSFTFGSPVNIENTYTYQLEKMMHDTEIINLGVRGLSTIEEHIVLRDYGLRYQPDLVLVQFHISDFYDSIDYTTRSETNQGIVNFIYKKSKFINWIYWKIKTSHFGNKLINSLRLNKNTVTPLTFTAKLLSKNYGADESVNESIEYVSNAFKNIKQTCNENDCDVIVFYIPTKYQVIDSETERFREEFGLAEDQIKIDNPQQTLKDFLEKEGITFLDFTEEIREKQKESKLYWEQDVHLNEAGYQFLAELLNNSLSLHLENAN